VSGSKSDSRWRYALGWLELGLQHHRGNRSGEKDCGDLTLHGLERMGTMLVVMVMVV